VGGDILSFANRPGKNILIRRRARYLLLKAPLDLINPHINQTIFQATFHTETR
jgi:hypothetical protein